MKLKICLTFLLMIFYPIYNCNDIVLQAQSRVIISPEGKIIKYNNVDNSKEILKTLPDKFSKNKPNTQQKITKVYKANNITDTLDYLDLGYYGVNFGLADGSIFMQYFLAPADLIVHAAGLSFEEGDNESVSIRLVKLNWTFEELTSIEPNLNMGAYPSIGDGLGEIDAFGDNATDNWIDYSEGLYPLPPWSNNIDPDQNTFNYDLWSDNGVGVVINSEVQNFGEYQWINMSDLGYEPIVNRGEVFALVIEDLGSSITFDYDIRVRATQSTSVPGWKYYEDGRINPGDGWWVRDYTWDFAVAVTITGDSQPQITDITELETSLTTSPRKVEAYITDSNPSGGSFGVANAVIMFSTDDQITWNEVNMSPSGNLYSGYIPGQVPGTTVSYKIKATDVNGLETLSLKTYSYDVFLQTPSVNTLVIFNGDSRNSDFDNYYFDNILTDNFLYDTWTFGKYELELLDHYSNVFEITTGESLIGGPDYYARDIITTWLENDPTRNYLLAGQEWLGVDNNYTDKTYESGSFEFNYLGIRASFNDVNYDGDIARRFESIKLELAPGSMLGDSLYLDFNNLGSDSLIYDVGIISQNWIDAFEPVNPSNVDLYVETRGINGAPLKEILPCAVHNTTAQGNKIVFLSYDPISIYSSPDDIWYGRRSSAPHIQALYWFGIVDSTQSTSDVPVLSSISVSNVSDSSARLNGTVNPNNLETQYYFEYGTTTSYGQQTETKTLNAGNTEVMVSETITGLESNTTYHYRLTATNSAGTAYSNEQTFATLADVDSLALEKEALVALYNSTNGANWTNNTNWLTDTPLDEWYGVTVEDGHVIAINLYENNLNGILPSNISNLSELTILNLYDNILTGSIPHELSQISSLVELSLGRNELSGSIPAELGNLSSLTKLSLFDNNLTENIPIELGNLSSLTGLFLSTNELSGSIPAELGNLSSLTELYLNNNELSGSIPPELGKLTSLSWLLLSNNQLTDTIPNQIGDLIVLRFLDLSNNQLTGVMPTQIGNVTTLETLILSNNQLTGTIPYQIGNLRYLDHLDLNSNKFYGQIPNEINNLDSLNFLFISYNSFTQFPALTISDIENIWLTNNKLTFEDIVPNIGIATDNFYYAPQDSVGIKKDTTIVEGNSFNISFADTTEGNQYQWKKNNVTINGANQNTFSIASFYASDQGSYTCEVTNPSAPDLTLYSRPVSLTVASSTAPTINNLSVTNISSNSATLNGSVTPNETSTQYYFEYGTTTSYGQQTPTKTLNAGDTEVSVSETISGLESNITYHCRLVATNSEGTTNSSDQTFTTESAQISLSSDELNFNYVKTNDSKGQQITITNPGSASLEISSILSTNSVFSVSTNSLSIPSSNSQPITISFKPTSAATYNESITLYHNASDGQTSISVSGIGFQYPQNISISHTYKFNGNKEQSSYRMFGIPGSQNINLSQCLTGKYGKENDWIAYDYSGGFVEYNSTWTFNPGDAYWIISTS